MARFPSQHHISLQSTDYLDIFRSCGTYRSNNERAHRSIIGSASRSKMIIVHQDNDMCGKCKDTNGYFYFSIQIHTNSFLSILILRSVMSASEDEKDLTLPAHAGTETSMLFTNPLARQFGSAVAILAIAYLGAFLTFWPGQMVALPAMPDKPTEGYSKNTVCDFCGF